MGVIKKVEVPGEGFVKTTSGSRPTVTGEQRAQLIRRGNELCNSGQFELAERIFVTLHYSDGMVRIGDAYFKRQEYTKAMRLYLQAPDPGRVDKLSKRMSLVVRQWLIEAGRRQEVQSVETEKTGGSL